MVGKNVKKEREIFHTFLRQHGLKKTRQKDLILVTFLKTEGHLSVEDLYALVRKQDKKVGVVTVFRTLKTLTACGIAREINLGDGLTRFEHSYHHPHHHHIVCTECHKAIEFVSPELEGLQDEIVRKYHFQPLHHRLQIYGICEDCREHRSIPEPKRYDTEKIFARDALRMAISMENRGLQFYQELARLNQDPEGRKLLEHIALEEEKHLADLEAELAQVQRQDKGLERAPVFLHFDPSDLERLVPDLTEYRQEGEFRLSPKRSLELAMVLEQRAADFFANYADKFLETQGKEIFQHFAEEERRHYESLNRRKELTIYD